jgi:hypothetical protein
MTSSNVWSKCSRAARRAFLDRDAAKVSPVAATTYRSLLMYRIVSSLVFNHGRQDDSGATVVPYLAPHRFISRPGACSHVVSSLEM